MTQTFFCDCPKKIKISVSYGNDEISKSVTKNNKYIPICNTSTASSTKEETNNYDQLVLTVKLRQRKTINNMEICFKFLEYIENILLYRLIYENGVSCAAIRYTGLDIIFQEICDDF